LSTGDRRNRARRASVAADERAGIPGAAVGERMQARGWLGFVVVMASAAPATAQAPAAAQAAAAAPVPAAAAAPADAAAPASGGDESRWQKLVERQQALERQLAAQQLQLQALQSAGPLARPEPPLRGPSLLVGDNPRDPELSAPLAGYSEKGFFLRDRHSWAVIQPKGRVNVDWYNYLNRPGPPAGVIANSAADPRSSLRDNIFLRRARLGVNGTFARHVDFRVEAEFASLAAAGQYATITDASVNLNWLPWLQLEAGQFYPPFTLENTASENSTDFMDKAGPIRWSVPGTRDTGAMVYGIVPRRLGRYYFGVFNGDGQNFKNLDNQPAIIGRAFISPLGLLPRHPQWVEDIWLGASFWWQHAQNIAGAGPASTSGGSVGDAGGLSTEGGFSAFSSNYGNGTDANKNAIRSHLAADGTILKWALEANVPITSRFGLRGEFIHQSIELRRYDDVTVAGVAGRTAGPRAFLDGYAGYAEAYVWIGGPVAIDKIGVYAAPHWSGYVPPSPPRWALQLAARYEHTEFAISGAPAPGSATKLDAADGHYALDTLLLGGSFWVTRQARLMANYALNYVGSGDPREASAIAAKNLFFQKYEHELLFRLQVNL
jgi:phosphate-selective porin O/P